MKTKRKEKKKKEEKKRREKGYTRNQEPAPAGIKLRTFDAPGQSFTTRPRGTPK